MNDGIDLKPATHMFTHPLTGERRWYRVTEYNTMEILIEPDRWQGVHVGPALWPYIEEIKGTQ